MARILTIDDDEHVPALLSTILTREGHEVVQATDGMAAATLLESTAVDLIITDLYMPTMDGIELIIRLHQQAPDARVIAISGGGYAASNDVLETARNLGVADTLAKPFSGDRLLAAVRDALE